MIRTKNSRTSFFNLDFFLFPNQRSNTTSSNYEKEVSNVRDINLMNRGGSYGRELRVASLRLGNGVLLYFFNYLSSKLFFFSNFQSLTIHK